MKVLIIAEACNPDWTSVPLVGWSLTLALYNHPLLNCHLVTQKRNAEAIEKNGRINSDDLTVIDSERVAGPIHRFAKLIRGGAGKGWTTVTALSSLYYPYFEHLIWKEFKDRICSGEFDIVHRITPLTPTSPSLLARTCSKAGVRFILGPLNGGVPWPAQFQSERRKEREWLSYLRGLYKLLPGYRGTRKHAAAIIVASIDTWKQVERRYRDKCVYIPENGIETEVFSPVKDRQIEKRVIRGAFIGRLVPYKGADMAIEAMSSLAHSSRIHLDIYGSGPESDRLHDLIEELGATNVTMHGFVHRSDLARRLANTDIMVFPSIREFGGGVVLEAMAVGAVPVVVDYAGPGELVTCETGYKIPMGSRKKIIESLRSLLLSIADDPLPLETMRLNGFSRIESLFTWNRKAEQVYSVYRWVLDSERTKPVFPFIVEDDYLQS